MLCVNFIVENDVPCMTPDEQSLALAGAFVIFNCVIPEYNHIKSIANCSNSQCQSFHETILNKSSMINLAVHLSYEGSFPTFLLKHTYDLSNLSNVKPVMVFWNSNGEFDWQKYDILISNETCRDFSSAATCPIKFSCTLPYSIGITITLFTLISTPVYLMLSVILIHRH